MNEKAQIGGILSIVAGGFGVLSGIGIALFAIVLLSALFNAPAFNAPGVRGDVPLDELILIMKLVYGGMGFLYVLVGALAVVGGIMAVKKKRWGLALAGAIAATIGSFPVGIAAIILISMSQPEFTAQRSPATPPLPPTPAG